MIDFYVHGNLSVPRYVALPEQEGTVQVSVSDLLARITKRVQE